MAVAIAVLLAWTLSAAHLGAIEDDEANRAVGQIESLINEPLSAVLADRRNKAAAERLASALAHETNQYVEAVRVYDNRGVAVYPASAPADPDNVRTTLQRAALWAVYRTDPQLGRIRTEYAPLNTGSSIAVVALDITIAQMAPQLNGEKRLVVLITLGAVGLIFVSLFTLALGASRELERRRIAAEGTFAKTLGVLAETLELRDPYTAGHSRRVATYSKQIALALGLSSREVDVIEYSALLHDIGKIGIPDAVLLKPGRLDERERSVINHHPSLGASILSSITSMEDIVPCVLHHHERVDGTGYPDRLGGDAIPLGARIVAVADTFDAMTSDRPYRRGLSAEVALAEIERVAGVQLDATVVAAFGRLVRSGEVAPPERVTDHFGPRLGSMLEERA